MERRKGHGEEEMRTERGNGDGERRWERGDEDGERRWRKEMKSRKGHGERRWGWRDGEAGELCPAEEVLWGRTPRTGCQPLGVLRGPHTGVRGPKNLRALENPSRTRRVRPPPPWDRSGCLELSRGRGCYHNSMFLVGRWTPGAAGVGPSLVYSMGVILLAFPCFGKG